MENYSRVYDIPFIDDLHNFFPALLYDQRQFLSLQDVFGYINRQMDRNFNIYTRAQRDYNQANPVVNTMPPLRRPPTTSTSSVIDLLPLIMSQNQTMNLSDYILSMLREPSVLEPVVVRPSQTQIDLATTLRSATHNEDRNCSVCQEVYTDGQAIRTINYCRHRFHKSCIDTWFLRNVHCPDCRYDIRTPSVVADQQNGR